MPKEPTFETAAQELAVDLFEAIQTFSARMGVVSPLPYPEQLLDLAGDIVASHFIGTLPMFESKTEAIAA